MDFIDEIEDNFKNLDFKLLPYKIYLLGTSGATILNVNSIIKISDTIIELQLKNNRIKIEGVNILLKSFKKGELYLDGKINKVEII